MADTHDLLLEVGTEELPPKSLKSLSDSFALGLAQQLKRFRLIYKAIEPYATPRRLALVVRDLAIYQPDIETVRKGPAVSSAIDANGVPTAAGLGFARSCKVAFEELETQETPKGPWLVFRKVQAGRMAKELIAEMAKRALAELPIAKRMRWGNNDDEFVRPVHWLTVILGQETVTLSLFGVESTGFSYGHRFHHPQAIAIHNASSYAKTLRENGFIEPSFIARRERIRGQVASLAMEAGGTPLMADGLLDEVTSLCEWPCAILGKFDKEFLNLPSEVLIETMQKNQKYFPILSNSGRLIPKFVGVSNIDSRDPTQVRAGYERVIRPRFADAAFFWQQDLKNSLETLALRLDRVVFHEKLGTLADKAARVSDLSRQIAKQLGIDAELVSRAARLAKADLVSEMVLEFPSLQGTMGRYYAQESGEDSCIVSAMAEQYLPRFAGDGLPQTDCGLVLSLADRLDTLVGIFATGQRPTGTKDPYGLRRASIGVLRILIETPLPLDLKDMFQLAAEQLKQTIDATNASEEVLEYSIERLRSYYEDRGVSSDAVESVLALKSSVPMDIHRRMMAVQDFCSVPQAESLAAANKRIQNILQKSVTAADRPSKDVDQKSLLEAAEQQLYSQIRAVRTEIQPLLQQQDYAGTLQSLAGLRDDVDEFFDKVMVMVDNDVLRRNRLALLKSVQDLFLQVADISLLK